MKSVWKYGVHFCDFAPFFNGNVKCVAWIWRFIFESELGRENLFKVIVDVNVGVEKSEFFEIVE